MNVGSRKMKLALLLTLLSVGTAVASWVISHTAMMTQTVITSEPVTFTDTFTDENIDCTSGSVTNEKTVTLVNVDENRTLNFELQTTITDNSTDDCSSLDSDVTITCDYEGSPIANCNDTIVSHAGQTETVTVKSEYVDKCCPGTVDYSLQISEST